MAKGQLGEKHPRARLTEDDVLAIRGRRAAGESVVDIAAAFGVAKSTLYSITRGETWTHVGGALTRGTAITSDDETLYQRWSKGERANAIAASFGVDERTVRRRIDAAGGRARRNADIRKMYMDGATQAKVGAAFGLGASAVSYIISSS